MYKHQQLEYGLKLIKDMHGSMLTGLIAKLALGEALRPSERVLIEKGIASVEFNGYIDRANAMRILYAEDQNGPNEGCSR